MAYATPEDLRHFIGRSSAFTAEETARAQLLLDLASGEVDDATGQGEEGLALRQDTVVLDGPGRESRWWEQGHGCRRLILPRWPVTAVAEVTLLHDTGDEEELAEGEGYTWSASGILTRTGGWWPTGPRAIRVLYTAGYAVIPATIRGIVLRTASGGWTNPGRLSAESLGDHSKSWATSRETVVGLELSPADRRKLGRYRAGAGQ